MRELYFANSTCKHWSLRTACDFLHTKSDSLSVSLLKITDILMKGEVVELHHARSLLHLDSSVPESEVIDVLVSHLPLYVYRDHPDVDFLILPTDPLEIINIVSETFKQKVSLEGSNARGTYTCGLCGVSGHTKPTCPRLSELG
ncbi:hypothetical protein GEMRC1_001698 [Eukaryota sp. GEM-RC1]